MKLHTGTNVVEKSGIVEQSGFSIEASAKAFFILSDGLYSNKVKAVIRELSTNAYDSHIEAGVADKPFDVHMPTRLEPVFHVRDYGTSMSHEDCMQLYTTYFRSTRNDSNEAVGCLGLGSKAPFAYADSFTVEAYLDGTRRLYTAYRDENSNPVFSLLDEVETDEPNGIKVSLAVDSDDVWNFKEEAQEVYKFFTVRPNFVGGDVEFDDGEIALSGKNWEFETGQYDNYIIMGQIPYPIDNSQVFTNNLPDEDQQAHNFLWHAQGLNLYLNIGDVDITPSRESLSYNSATKEAIKQAVKDVLLEVNDTIEQQIADQPTLFAARQQYVSIQSQCSAIASAMKALDQSPVWNGEDLFDTMIGNKVTVPTKDGNRLISITRYSTNGWHKKVDIDHGLENVYFASDIKLVVDNLKKGGISRIRRYIKENEGNNGATIYCHRVGENGSPAEFYEFLGGATEEDVIFTADLPKMVYDRSSSGGGGPAVHAQVYDHELGSFVVCNMSVKYENAHYFEESRGDVHFGGTYWGITALADAIKILDSMGYDLSEHAFYLIKPSVATNRNLGSRENWTLGHKVIQDAVSKAREDHLDNIIRVYTQYDLTNENNGKFRDVLGMTKTDNKAKSIMAEYDEYVEEIKVIESEMRTLQRLIDRCPSVEKCEWETVEDEDEKFAIPFDKEFEKYPMLEHASGGYWMDGDKKEDCAKYIDLVENCVDK